MHYKKNLFVIIDIRSVSSESEYSEKLVTFYSCIKAPLVLCTTIFLQLSSFLAKTVIPGKSLKIVQNCTAIGLLLYIVSNCYSLHKY
jgi:hypothetical protein